MTKNSQDSPLHEITEEEFEMLQSIKKLEPEQLESLMQVIQELIV